jgi:hypothetical protein
MSKSPVPRPKSANDLQVTVLLPSELVDRLDARAAAKSQEQGLTVTRADILRLVIRRGLEALDAEHPPEGKRRRS